MTASLEELAKLGIALRNGKPTSSFEGVNYGKPVFVLITGFEKSVGVDRHDGGVLFQNITKYTEIPERDLNYVFNQGISKEGYMVFTFLNKRYDAYIPKQPKKEAITKRFASPPEERIVPLVGFATRRADNDENWRRVVVDFMPEYTAEGDFRFPEGITQLCDGKNVFLAEDMNHKPRNLVFLAKTRYLKTLVRNKKFDPRFKGITIVHYGHWNNPMASGIAIGEAYDREQEYLKKARGRHVKLGAFPSEVAEAHKLRESLKPKDIILTPTDTTRIIESYRASLRKE